MSDSRIVSGGFIRLKDLIGPNGPLPVSKSTVYRWCTDGRLEKPIKLSAGVSAWRVETIHAFLARAEEAMR